MENVEQSDMTLLEQILSEIDAKPIDPLPLAEVSGLIGLSSPTMVKKIKRGEIEATFSSRKYWITKTEAKIMASKNFSKIRGWERLVDVCKRHKIHRNIGEAVCKRANQHCELDLNGHMRIPPEAEEVICAWIEEKEEKKDWVRKIDFAEKLNTPPTVVDTVCRKLNLPFDHDINGFVILSPEAQRGFIAWQEHRDTERQPILDYKGRRYYSLAHTVEQAATFFARQDSDAFDKVARMCYCRISFWMRGGVKFHTFNEQKYFSQRSHDLLVDALCIADAARIAGVPRDTIQSWIDAGELKLRKTVSSRDTLSKTEFIAVLRKKYATSPALKRKKSVPLHVLPSLDEVIERGHFRGEDGLLGALRDTEQFKDAELEPLVDGYGMVPVKLKRLLASWMERDASQTEGTEIHPEYLGVLNETCKDQARRLLRRRAAPSKDALVALISAATGVVRHNLEPCLFGDVTGTYLPLTTVDFLDRVEEHGHAAFYTPDARFEQGDLLVHPTAEDFGIVREVLDTRRISVAWRGLGDLTMVHGETALAAS